MLSGAANSQLAGVSCTSASSCEAVGSSGTGPNFDTLAEVLNGGTWTIQTTPNPGGATFSELNSVSCTSASSVHPRWARTWRTGGGTGASWALQKIASPHGSAPANLASVSCTGSIRCMAVGSFFRDGVQMLVTDQWDGSKWAVEPAPLSTSADSEGLSSVSCVHATSCTAVGFYHDPVDGNRALAENWALRWQLPLPAVPVGAIAEGRPGQTGVENARPRPRAPRLGDDELQRQRLRYAVAEGWNGHTLDC